MSNAPLLSKLKDVRSSATMIEELFKLQSKDGSFTLNKDLADVFQIDVGTFNGLENYLREQALNIRNEILCLIGTGVILIWLTLQTLVSQQSTFQFLFDIEQMKAMITAKELVMLFHHNCTISTVMDTNQQQYDEQLQILQERYPQTSKDKLIRLLQRHNKDVDQVCARLIQKEDRANKRNTLETRFGTALTALQQELPWIQSMRRIRLLKMMERFNGDIEQVRKFLQTSLERHRKHGESSNVSKLKQQEELKAKYATQLAELNAAGIDINCSCILRRLEKNQGDITKIMEKISHRAAKKEKLAMLDKKYTHEIAQLEADGVVVKNKHNLIRLLEKANGQIDVAKQLLNEKKEKHDKKHRDKTKEKTDEKDSKLRKRRELSADNINNLKRLRSAGVHGNPKKILAIFHECNQSIEVAIARNQEEQERRHQSQHERKLKRQLLAEAENSYITINNRDDWPKNIEKVYLDGNNMMFVVDSLRRLCLNRAGKKTERALGELASAWNEQMHIQYVELIFDSTHQLDQIGTIKVSSAQPKYRTTDDMLVEIARQDDNREKNNRTVVVTSDRGLAALLQREGCLLVKSYHWFAHCVMTLAPDLIDFEELKDKTIATTSAKKKNRYNFDELLHRIANIDI
ncbi:unnamed protein product [Rotaria sp. Silwood1]|nr:unnamed protein product [Rotaria sp. Silwood1]